MSSYYLRFVGADTLPKSLSKREVEECFGLSVEDIQELRPPRFRGTARLGAAVQLVMLRATGRHTVLEWLRTPREARAAHAERGHQENRVPQVTASSQVEAVGDSIESSQGVQPGGDQSSTLRDEVSL